MRLAIASVGLRGVSFKRWARRLKAVAEENLFEGLVKRRQKPQRAELDNQYR